MLHGDRNVTVDPAKVFSRLLVVITRRKCETCDFIRRGRNPRAPPSALKYENLDVVTLNIIAKPAFVESGSVTRSADLFLGKTRTVIMKPRRTTQTIPWDLCVQVDFRTP